MASCPSVTTSGVSETERCTVNIYAGTTGVSRNCPRGARSQVTPSLPVLDTLVTSDAPNSQLPPPPPSLHQPAGNRVGGGGQGPALKRKGSLDANLGRRNSMFLLSWGACGETLRQKLGEGSSCRKTGPDTLGGSCRPCWGVADTFPQSPLRSPPQLPLPRWKP